MADGLFETSSIFSRNGEGANYVSASTQLTKEEIKEVVEEVDRCRTISVGNHSDNANIRLVSLFPDSMYSIIYDANFKHFYVANIDGKSFILEVPFMDIKVELVGLDMLVVTGHPVDGKLATYVIQGRDYSILESFNPQFNGSKVTLGGKNYDLQTSETQPPTEVNGEVKYYFRDKAIVLKDRHIILEEDRKTGRRVLISDANGCYIGYYLEVREGDGLINFGGNSHKTLGRLSYALMGVLNVETLRVFLVPCIEQELIPIEVLTDSSWEQIAVVNGVAYLIKMQKSNPVFHIFTPKHQQVVLSRSFKVDTKNVGNGIIFPKDNAIILDSGMLRFIEKMDRRTMYIPKEDVQISLPCKFLNIEGGSRG